MALIVQGIWKNIYRARLEAWKTRDRAAQEKSLFREFLKSIKDQLKVQIIFDAEIVDVLIDTIATTRQNKSVDGLHQHLNQMKTFAQFLFNKKFIQKQHKEIIFNSVSKERETNDDLLIFALSRYLSSCDSKEQFQEEWMDKSPIHQYDHFWLHYIAQKRQSIKMKLNSIYECFKTQGIDSELQPDIVSELQNYFSNIQGNNLQQVEINRKLEIMVKARTLKQNSAQTRRFDTQYKMIKQLMCEFRYSFDTERFSLQMTKFGSLCNGFATQDADLDITILTNCWIEEKKIIENMFNFFQFKLLNTNYIVKSLIGASTPIIQISKKGDKADKQKIDIAFNNICGVINSRFLKTYSDMHEGIKILGILIKLWAKKHGLIHPQKLSSYSFILMMLYYLIKVKAVPNILVNLKGTDRQKQCVKIKRVKKDEKEEFPIYNIFEIPKKKILKFNVYQHLLGFMNFYKEDGRYFQEGHAISLDLSEKPLEQDKIFTIKDPFDEPHNPGRWGISYKGEIMREIKSAIKQLESLKIDSIRSLFI